MSAGLGEAEKSLQLHPHAHCSMVKLPAMLMFLVHASTKGHVWVHGPAMAGGHVDVHGLCYRYNFKEDVTNTIITIYDKMLYKL